MIKIASVITDVNDQQMNIELTSSWDRLTVNDLGSETLVEIGNSYVIVRDRKSGKTLFSTALEAPSSARDTLTD